MSESDKEKLELFELRYREVSKAQTYNYNPEDWYALQQMMNQDDRKRKPIVWIFLGSSLLILGLIVGIVFLNNDFEYNGLDLEDNKKSIAKSSTTSHSSEKLYETINIQEENDIIDNKSIVTPTSEIHKPSESSILPSSSENNNQETQINSNQNNTLELDNKPNQPPYLSESTDNVSHNVALEPRNSRPVNKEKFESMIPSISKHQENIIPIPLHNIKKLESDNKLILPIANQIEVKSSRLTPRFLFNINGGVEVSQTPKGTISDTDFSLGIKFGYVVSNKVVLSAGVSYIRECYTAATSDYSVPSGFWQGNPPDQVQAVCDMVDFTIGASYHFNGVLNNGLIAHLNLSSNNMVREVYEYQFINNEANNWIDEFSFDNSTLLSNLEIGASYKFFANSRYFIDGGPFMKIPINGIGNGDVRLRSFGFKVGISFLD